MGTPEFAVPSLRALHREGYPIHAVVTAPEKPRGRGRKQSATAVGEYALTNQIPLLSPVSLRDPEFISSIRDLRPDILVVVAFRILPQEVFALARIGAFNLHASLLPSYRGAAPINRAIMNGETQTGLTTFLLAGKVDTGRMLLQRPYPINPEDDAGTLHDRLAIEGSIMVLETVRILERGDFTTLPQDDARATAAPKITKEDCLINWNRPAVQIHNQIRGLSPSPAAYTSHRGKVLKIYKSTVTSKPASDVPGVIRKTTRELLVSTADVLLAIEQIQLEGKKRMAVEDFLRGYGIEEGERLG